MGIRVCRLVLVDKRIERARGQGGVQHDHPPDQWWAQWAGRSPAALGQGEGGIMRLFELIPAQFRIAVVSLMLVLLASGSAALAWTVQGWRCGQQLERQAGLQADTLNELSQAAAALKRTEQEKRFALEQRLQNKDETHYKELTDEQIKQARLRDRLATADLRCQSYSPPPMPPATVQCQPPPPPAAWFMAPQEPNLTQRMLNELSTSPMPATKD